MWPAFLAVCAFVGKIEGQIVVSSPAGAQAMVELLVGEGVQVFNVQYTGAPLASGLFTDPNGVLGFDAGGNRGIVLTTGRATAAQGPNTGNTANTNNLLGGTPLLNPLAAPYTGHDATVLEFDFIPSCDTLRFRYR
ncbi:MAG: choice-of-anchor L domain-containing protein, partial [Bacteroidia bacterium]|nr:choice-of-anchor L domain-containing protein [Bacteroidia bacterium]MDW8335148.1 choice-of-anchor L domain-containing protein [Bacteroidia bacterium]